MTAQQPAKTFLFSIDLEDVRLKVKNGHLYKPRVADNTHRYLEWLNRHKAKCTFFTTGNVAELYPSLINDIVREDHEVACHTSQHVPISSQSPDEFRKDITENINVLAKCGASAITGFRAPIYSLTEKTQWAYSILADLGITYSSSVFPERNPLYGWRGFGHEPRKVNDRILEIPLTVGKFGPLKIPLASGLYLRVLPAYVTRQNIRRLDAAPLVTYVHPYDIDEQQERFMHADIQNNRFYNYLMYYNRHKVFDRLDLIMAEGFSIIPYRCYVKKYLNG